MTKTIADETSNSSDQSHMTQSQRIGLTAEFIASLSILPTLLNKENFKHCLVMMVIPIFANQ